MANRFKHVMLMVADMQAAVRFYTEGLGLRMISQSPMWVELDAEGTIIALHSASEGARAGSSPLLSFYVDDLQASLEMLKNVGGRQEGGIREPSFGKVAAVRAPEGTLISLTEPKKSQGECPSGHGE